MQNFCTFYLVRHGETNMNASAILQGQRDSSLTDKGKEQAIQLAKELKPIHFDAVFSSDLSRAKDTANIVAKQHNIALKTTELLRERKWGRFEGQSIEVLKEFDEVFQSLNDEEKAEYKTFEEIENDKELASRFITFIREVAVAYPEKTILLVSHGGVIGTFLIHIGFWTYHNVLPKIPNGSYIKFKSDGIEFFVEEVKGFDGITPRELRNSDR